VHENGISYTDAILWWLHSSAVLKAYCWCHYHQQLVSVWLFSFKDVLGFSSQLLWACSLLLKFSI